MKALLVAGPIALAMASAVPPQNLVWTRSGVQDTYGFGISPQVIGDLDSDGFADLLIPVTVPINMVIEPEFWILSGADGRTLQRRRYSNQSIQWRQMRDFGIAGDHDGDGITDWWWSLGGSAVPNGLVQVRSTATDLVLFEVGGSGVDGFGLAVAAGLNIDGDGKPDVAVTALRPTPQAPRGEIRVFGNDGRLLYRASPPVGCFMSWGLANLGDLDMDGRDEIGATCADVTERGVVVVFSGATGSVLHVSPGEQAWDWMDQEVAAVGDVDRDGVPDHAAGGFWSTTRGTARIFSGRTGLPLRTYVSPYSGRFGCTLAGNIDADRDGVVDLLVMSPTEQAAPREPQGAIYCFSGRTGSVLFKLHPTASNEFTLMSGFAVLPALPANPFPLIAFVEPNYESRPNRLPDPLGRVIVMRTDPPGSGHLGSGCACSPLARGPDIGMSLRPDGLGRLTLQNPTSPLTALLVGASNQRWGAFPLPLDLAPLGLVGCSLRTSVDLVWPGTRVAPDLALVDLPIPFGIWGIHDRFLFAQWLFDEGGCTRVSGGVWIRTR